MAQRVAYHFHGYQPGDIVRLLPGSPFDPPRWEERHAPVALRVGDQRIAGRNWTDALFASYAAVADLLDELAGEVGAHACSIDVEPFTLEMLLRRDAREDGNTYGRIIGLFRRGVADPVVTLPFHPILPYLDPFEQEVLAGVAADFYAPLLEGLRPAEGPLPLGLWLPEAAFTRAAAATAVAGLLRRFGGAVVPYLILDARQLLRPPPGYPLWSLNYVDLDGRRVYLFGRDPELSDAYAFGGAPVDDLVARLARDRVDPAKEKAGVPYLVTLASDLEALVGGPRQIARFHALVAALAARGAPPTSPAEFLRGKLLGRLRRWEDEGEGEAFRALVKEFSSWSDYGEEAVGGRTSDTRWQGMRRVDGLVIARPHRGRPVSQLWKQGLLAVEAAVETAIRRHLLRLLRSAAPGAPREAVVAFLVAYGRTVFRGHHRRQGRGADEGDAAAAIEEHLGRVGDPEAVALAARAYYEMLMGLRSDPCFWDNLDTRVTFQGALLLAHALLDMADALRRAGMAAAADQALALLRTHLVGFEEAYHLFRLGSLAGRRGWETSEEAWLAALQSEVPELSGYNCVKRAALHALLHVPSPPPGLGVPDPAQAVAATGHIAGEAHGLWEREEYCEDRR